MLQVPQNGWGVNRHVTGRFLAHNRLSRARRSFLSAELNLGVKQLVEPTLTQAAMLAGVSRASAFWAIRRMAERAEIEAGLLPLTPPRSAPNKISDAEIAAVIRSAGLDRMLAVAVVVEAEAV